MECIDELLSIMNSWRVCWPDRHCSSPETVWRTACPPGGCSIGRRTTACRGMANENWGIFVLGQLKSGDFCRWPIKMEKWLQLSNQNHAMLQAIKRPVRTFQIWYQRPMGILQTASTANDGATYLSVVQESLTGVPILTSTESLLPMITSLSNGNANFRVQINQSGKHLR